LCASYLFWFYAELADRPGNPTQMDLIVSVVGLIMLLEATRRALGPPLMVVAGVFIIYTFFGPYMPSVIAHKGASLGKGHVPLLALHRRCLRCRPGGFHRHGLHVRALRRFAGVGRRGQLLYPHRFCRAWSSARRPAKAAVVSSGLTGLVSGSSIANVVTTGTFTIP
jgi:TRAP-type uncharacterized transport system fused permease subunit